MRIPLEYGDNFPVPTGDWDPTVPWRFPKHEILPSRVGWLSRVLPWVTLGLGVTLGILWMSWRAVDPPGVPSASGVTAVGATIHPASPASRPPVRLRSRLA